MKKIIIAAALTACAAVVTAQTVTSANIVGYSKTTLAASQLQIVSPQFLDGGADMTLEKAFGGTTEGSKVYIWDGSKYLVATYFDGYGWFDSLFNPLGATPVGGGDALWLEDGGTGSEPIMSGEVPMDASITNSLYVGLTQVANPYPTAIVLNDIPLVSLSEGDVVYLWDGSKYLVATYFVGYGWFDSLFNPLGTTPVAVGQGFWLQSAAGGDLVFNKNF